jgi:hypothetical protein
LLLPGDFQPVENFVCDRPHAFEAHIQKITGPLTEPSRRQISHSAGDKKNYAGQSGIRASRAPVEMLTVEKKLKLPIRRKF